LFVSQLGLPFVVGLDCKGYKYMNEDFWLIYLNYLGEKHTRNNIGGASEQRPPHK
jgi:hypothetical protein